MTHLLLALQWSCLWFHFQFVFGPSAVRGRTRRPAIPLACPVPTQPSPTPAPGDNSKRVNKGPKGQV